MWKVRTIGRGLSTRGVCLSKTRVIILRMIGTLRMIQLLAAEILLGLLLQLLLLPLHNLAELVGRSLLVSLVLLLLLGTLRSTTNERLVEKVLVLAGASRVAARALGYVGFTGVHADEIWMAWLCCLYSASDC